MGAIRTPMGEQAGGAAQPPWRRSTAERKRVLVVEDNDHDREVYGRVLLYNGFDVIFAGTGAQALERVRTHRPDLILLDILLPDAHGLELCMPLREAGGEVPVVLLTALSEEDFGARARQAGCGGVL
jgi:CheY-like chemotaxis protein